ncbi:MAG: hypothetical protein ACRC1H_10005 [Caldilineaceae bacterium]
MQRTTPELHMIPTLVVSRPGIMRQALRSSLAAFPGINIIGACGDGLSALHMLAEHRPHLLVVDSNLLDEEVEALLATVRKSWPAIFSVALLYTRSREAKVLAAGASAAVQRDQWSTEFRDVLVKLPQPPVAPAGSA